MFTKLLTIETIAPRKSLFLHSTMLSNKKKTCWNPNTPVVVFEYMFGIGYCLGPGDNSPYNAVHIATMLKLFVCKQQDKTRQEFINQ